MYRLPALLLLMTLLSACGDESHIYDSHSSNEVVFKGVNNTVSGSVVPPAGRRLVSVLLSYDGNFRGDGVAASPCQPEVYVMLTGSQAEHPQALFCQDNNFYFSGLTSASFTIRAIFDDNTFLDGEFFGILTNTEVTMTEYNEWNGRNGTELSVANSSNSLIIR